MAVSAYERQVMILNLEVTYPDGAHHWTPAAFFNVLQRLYNANGGSAEVSEGLVAEAEEEEEEDGEVVVGPVLSATKDATETAEAMAPPPGAPVSKDGLMRIADMRTAEDGTVTILIHHGDRLASDPALMHLQTGKITITEKGDTHGLAHGAHLVIQTGMPGASKSTRAKAVLERAPNLGRTSVVTFLNTLIRRTCRHNGLRYINAEGKNLRYSPKLGATQPLSASVKKDIAGGRISNIVLIKRNPATGLDEPGVKPKVMTLTHVVDPGYPRTKNLGLLEKIRQFGIKEGYDDLEVGLRGSKENKAMTPRFAMDYADAQDVVYARMEAVSGFRDKLAQCPETVVDEVLLKMHAMFGQPGKWK